MFIIKFSLKASYPTQTIHYTAESQDPPNYNFIEHFSQPTNEVSNINIGFDDLPAYDSTRFKKPQNNVTNTSIIKMDELPIEETQIRKPEVINTEFSASDSYY